jgi:hypothetical protein
LRFYFFMVSCFRQRYQEEKVARKTVLVCDSCGAEVDEGKGAVQRVTFNDARRGAKAADLCDSCAGKAVGHQVARRGRKPKALAA